METDDMNDPGLEHQVQPGANVPAASAFSDRSLEGPSIDDTLQGGEQRQRTIAAGTAFGAFVGLLMGPAVGASCCWLTDAFNFFWHGVVAGALAGPLAGALIGLTERKARGRLVRPDIGTFVGVAFGLFPALLVILQGLTSVMGKFGGYALIGGGFTGPMLGLVIGGILDRAFEEGLKKSWGRALAFAVAASAICIGLVCLMDNLAYGPDPNEVSREVRALLVSQWSKNPDWEKAAIQKVSLARKGRTTYTGFADVTLGGQPERFRMEVAVEGGMIEVSWLTEPGQ